MFEVSAGWRRRGFGRQLMDDFVQRCVMRGLRRIELEVRISNEEAIRFYKRYGFEIAAGPPKFYTDGGDGFKMGKHFLARGSTGPLDHVRLVLGPGRGGGGLPPGGGKLAS